MTNFTKILIVLPAEYNLFDDFTFFVSRILLVACIIFYD